MLENDLDEIISSVISIVDNTLNDISGTQITSVSEMTNALLDIRGRMMKLQSLEKVDA